jgi:hypothetical protein
VSASSGNARAGAGTHWARGVRNPHRRRHQTILLAVAIVACSAAAVAWLASPSPTTAVPAGPRPEPGVTAPALPTAPTALASRIRVVLQGIPSGAVVRVDGIAIAGPTLDLPRDGRSRSIEVSAPGRSPWITTHACTMDGAYSVQLALAALPPVTTQPDAGPGPSAPHAGSTRPAGRRSFGATGGHGSAGAPLFRNPDF